MLSQCCHIKYIQRTAGSGQCLQMPTQNLMASITNCLTSCHSLMIMSTIILIAVVSFTIWYYTAVHCRKMAHGRRQSNCLEHVHGSIHNAGRVYGPEIRAVKWKVWTECQWKRPCVILIWKSIVILDIREYVPYIGVLSTRVDGPCWQNHCRAMLSVNTARVCRCWIHTTCVHGRQRGQ